MTVSTELSHEEYTGNGVTTDFDFCFRILKAEHLVVSVADQDGTERILTNGTDYTLRGVGSYRGGKVILKMPLATGWKIGIARDLPAVQETDLRNQGKFFAEVHEDAFDYLTMLIQKSLGYLSLCLRKPSFISDHYDAKGNKVSNLGKPVKDGDAVDLGTMKEHISAKDKRSLRVADKDIPVLPNAVNRANKLLSFDNNGNPVVTVPESGSAADVLIELGKSSGAGMVGTESGKSLQQAINNKQERFSLSALEYGAIPDRESDNTYLIQSIIDEYENTHIYLTIEPNILWHFKDVNMKNGVNIIDMSGWDDEYSHWNEHIKYHFNHNVDNNQHNGNTLHVLGRHHPALVVDNIGTKDDPEGEEHRASIIFRENGKLKARIGIGRSDSDSDLIITDNKLRTRIGVACTNQDDFELGINGAHSKGVDYSYGAVRDADIIHRKQANTGKGISEQYSFGGKVSVTIKYENDGSILYSQNGANTINMLNRGEVIGLRKSITYASSLSLVTGQSGAVLVNHSSSATSGYNLPIGVGNPGVYYTFINTTGSKITISARSGESFLAGGGSKDLTSLGECRTAVSMGDGKWSFS